MVKVVLDHWLEVLFAVVPGFVVPIDSSSHCIPFLVLVDGVVDGTFEVLGVVDAKGPQIVGITRLK